MSAASSDRQHWLVAINEPYMTKIIDGEKDHEFRKYLMQDIVYLWFYQSKPKHGKEPVEGLSQHITHVCHIDKITNRNDAIWENLPRQGNGNHEYNSRASDWEGYDYAYRIRSVYKIKEPISVEQMQSLHRIRPPQGRLILPRSIKDQHPVNQQSLVRQYRYDD